MKKVSSYLLTSIMVAGALVASAVPAYAAANPDLGQIDREASIQFEEKVDPVTPEIIDPTKPENPDPVIPVDPIVPPMSGPLTIDHVSLFKFGTVKISGNTKVYDAELTSVNDQGLDKDSPNFIQVTDDRGRHKGWNLQVKQEADFQIAGTNDKLTKTTLVMNYLAAQKRPTNDATSPAVAQGSLIIGKEFSTVASANAGTGMGSHTIVAGTLPAETAQKGVQLTVPGNIEKAINGQYTANLIWQLSTDPSTINN